MTESGKENMGENMKPVPAFILSLSEILPHFLLSAQHGCILAILEKRVICWLQFHCLRISATVMSISLKQEILKSLTRITLHIYMFHTKPKRIRYFSSVIFLVSGKFLHKTCVGIYYLKSSQTSSCLQTLKGSERYKLEKFDIGLDLCFAT